MTATRKPVSAQTPPSVPAASSGQATKAQPVSSGQKIPTEGKAATLVASGAGPASTAPASSLPSPSPPSLGSSVTVDNGSIASNEGQQTQTTASSSPISSTGGSAPATGTIAASHPDQSAGGEGSALPLLAAEADSHTSGFFAGVGDASSIIAAASSPLPSEPAADTDTPTPSVAEYSPPVGGRPFDYIPAPGDGALALDATGSDTPEVQVNEKVVIGTSCAALLLAVCVTAVLCRYRKRFHRQSGQTVRDWIYTQSSQDFRMGKGDSQSKAGLGQPSIFASAWAGIQGGLALGWRTVRREPAIALPPDTARPTTIQSFTSSPVALGHSHNPPATTLTQAKKRFFLPVLSSPLYTPSPTAIGSPGRPLLLGNTPNSPASPLTPPTPVASRMRPRSRPLLRSSWSAANEGACSPSLPLATTPARLFSPITPAINLPSPPPALQRGPPFERAANASNMAIPSAHLLQAPKPVLSCRQSDNLGGESVSVYSGVSEGLSHYPFVLEKK